MSFWVSPEELMESPMRTNIMELIRAYPGINFRKIADALESAPGTIQWHTDRMVKVGLLKSETVGTRRIFLPTDWSADECATARIAARFRDPVPASVFREMQRQSPSCVHELEQATGHRVFQIKEWVDDFLNLDVMTIRDEPTKCLAKQCAAIGIHADWMDFPVGDF